MTFSVSTNHPHTQPLVSLPTTLTHNSMCPYHPPLTFEVPSISRHNFDKYWCPTYHLTVHNTSTPLAASASVKRLLCESDDGKCSLVKSVTIYVSALNLQSFGSGYTTCIVHKLKGCVPGWEVYFMHMYFAAM